MSRNAGQASHVFVFYHFIVNDWFRKAYEARLLTCSHDKCPVDQGQLSLRNLIVVIYYKKEISAAT